MTTYTIIPTDNGSSFNIGVAGSNGTRQTMLGFATEAEAEAWISQDKRLSGSPNTHEPGGSCGGSLMPAA